jgi:hypothetical protein
MDDDSVSSKPSAFFDIKDLYGQAEELGLRKMVPAQRKLTLTDHGLGLRLSTGTQLDEDEPARMKKIKSCYPTSKAKVVKHTFGSIMQHMQELKGGLSTRTIVKELDETKAATKENEAPTTNENENDILTPPFVVDLLTQEEHSLEPPREDWWATNGPDPQWTRIFQARATEGGMDLYVEQGALKEVAGSLLRDLTTEKSDAEKSVREY